MAKIIINDINGNNVIAREFECSETIYDVKRYIIEHHLVSERTNGDHGRVINIVYNGKIVNENVPVGSLYRNGEIFLTFLVKDGQRAKENKNYRDSNSCSESSEDEIRDKESTNIDEVVQSSRKALKSKVSDLKNANKKTIIAGETNAIMKAANIASQAAQESLLFDKPDTANKNKKTYFINDSEIEMNSIEDQIKISIMLDGKKIYVDPTNLVSNNGRLYLVKKRTKRLNVYEEIKRHLVFIRVDIVIKIAVIFALLMTKNREFAFLLISILALRAVNSLSFQIQMKRLGQVEFFIKTIFAFFMSLFMINAERILDS